MKKIVICCAVLIAVTAMGMGIYLSSFDMASVVVTHSADNASIGIIGGADGPTTIFLAGQLTKSDMMWMAVGGACLVAAVVLAVYAGYRLIRSYISKKKQQ